jgi:hypothetical protein
MRAASCAHTHDGDIGRSGEPAGVAMLNSPWGRTTARVGTIRSQPVPSDIQPNLPRTLAGLRIDHYLRRLPTNADANYAPPVVDPATATAETSTTRGADAAWVGPTAIPEVIGRPQTRNEEGLCDHGQY